MFWWNMKNEAQFKQVFKKSVSKAGGVAISLAAPMVSGIPDLYCLLPNRQPVLLEAKFLRGIKRSQFFRKIPYSTVQHYYLKQCDQRLRNSAMGLIGLEWNGDIYAVLMEASEVYITHDFIKFKSWSKLDKVFNVDAMFNRFLFDIHPTKNETTLVINNATINQNTGGTHGQRPLDTADTTP
jgi:hypothetical protein